MPLFIGGDLLQLCLGDLLALVDRFRDPLVLLRRGALYHPDFNGSFSLKSVLPALFPDDEELSYKNLEIQQGEMASETYATLHLVADPAEREQIRANLLTYCGLDTYAMVKIHEYLQGMV